MTKDEIALKNIINTVKISKDFNLEVIKNLLNHFDELYKYCDNDFIAVIALYGAGLAADMTSEQILNEVTNQLQS
jgi:hypothetical protein